MRSNTHKIEPSTDDLAEKVKALEEYNQQLEKKLYYLNSIIQLIPGNIYWKDRSGKYLGCNNGIVELSNFSSSEDIVGKTLYDIFDYKHAQEINEIDEKIMSTATIETIEETGYDKNGQQAVYLTKKVPLKNIKDEVIGLLGVTFDITDRKKIEQELIKAKEVAETANRAKSVFLSIMSHELRNTIGNIMGAVNLAQSYLDKLEMQDKDLCKYITLAYDQADSILPFLKNVTEYLELEGGLIDSKMVPIQLNNMLNRLAKTHSSQLKKQSTHLILSLTDELPNNILIDNYNLYRVLDIIINNAIRFTQNGTITVKSYINTQSELIINIYDTGIGIPEAHLKNIFNAFVSESNDGKSAYRKFGLRLSLARKIMRLIGGDIQINSREGAGTEVILFVPYKLSNDGVLKEDIPTYYAPLNKSLKILVVEDDLVSLDLQVSILKSLGHQVDAVALGVDAIKSIKKQHYDLIFMDITLPDITGIEATRQIREIAKGNIPIVAVTSHVTDEAIEDILSNGLDDIIEKPISKEKFEKFFNYDYFNIVNGKDDNS